MSGMGRKLALTPAKSCRTGAWSKRRPWASSPRPRDDRWVGPPCALTTASARKPPARCVVACLVPESSAVAVAWERTAGCRLPARSRQRGCRPGFWRRVPLEGALVGRACPRVAGSSGKFPWVEGNLRAGGASMAGAPARFVRRDDSSCVRTAKLPFRQALMPVGDPTAPVRSGHIPFGDALLPSGRASPAGRGPAPARGDPRSDPRRAFRGFDEPSRCLRPAGWPAVPSRRTGQGSASPGRPRS